MHQRQRHLPTEDLLHPRHTESVTMEQRAERTLRIAVNQRADQFQNDFHSATRSKQLKAAEYRPRIAFRRLRHGTRQMVMAFAGRCIGAIPNRPNIKKMIAKSAVAAPCRVDPTKAYSPHARSNRETIAQSPTKRLNLIRLAPGKTTGTPAAARTVNGNNICGRRRTFGGNL